MASRDARAARALGLWTASWLAVLLLAGVLRLGDLSVQWPVLLVPVLWAAVALRPRRGHERSVGRDPYRDGDRRRNRDRPQDWEELPLAERTDTVERPYLRDRTDRRRGY